MNCRYLSRLVSSFFPPFNCIFTHLPRKYKWSMCFFCSCCRVLVLLSNQRTLQDGKQHHYANKHIHACTRMCVSSGFRATNKRQKFRQTVICSFVIRPRTVFLFPFFFFRLLFFSFPRGQASPLAYVSREGREARDTIILPFFHQRKIELRAERKSLERGHQTCLTRLLCSHFQWEANGLGGGLSGCTHYSPVSTAPAEAGL